jgi:hypothetical protein
VSDQDLSDSSGSTAERPGLAEIADVFARYGNFTLGGGSATSAVIHGQIVTLRRWVNDQQFTLCFALGRLTPGTNVLAFCTVVSTERRCEIVKSRPDPLVIYHAGFTFPTARRAHRGMVAGFIETAGCAAGK